ncbi:phage tail tube protein [Rapidithrix thailandica]|uniref:Phage tail tube protein n=1 Tax=Rapidithrix thailandica TaxID=413964 RepID=A0AAW9SD75_9BACT
MPTTGKIIGKNIKLFIDDDPLGAGNEQEVGCATDSTLNLETAMVEATCKQDGDFYDAVPGKKSGTMDIEGLIIYNNPINWTQYLDIWKNSKRLKVRYGTDQTGDTEFICDAYLTSYSATAPVEEVATYSASLQLVGKPTIAAKA